MGDSLGPWLSLNQQTSSNPRGTFLCLFFLGGGEKNILNFISLPFILRHWDLRNIFIEPP